MGNVSEGVDGFQEMWFGRLMQSIRRRIVVGDRAGVPYCSRCNCAFSKCDWVNMWPKPALESYWVGDEWKPLPPQKLDDEVFAPGWETARQVTAALPTRDEEHECLTSSTKRIIKSTAAVDAECSTDD